MAVNTHASSSALSCIRLAMRGERKPPTQRPQVHPLPPPAPTAAACCSGSLPAGPLQRQPGPPPRPQPPMLPPPVLSGSTAAAAAAGPPGCLRQAFFTAAARALAGPAAVTSWPACGRFAVGCLAEAFRCVSRVGAAPLERRSFLWRPAPTARATPSAQCSRPRFPMIRWKWLPALDCGECHD